MDACSTCGARLAPNVSWCPQCFARLAPRSEPNASSRAAGARRRSVVPGFAPQYSRWRGGDTAFGPLGRAVLTLLVLAGLVAGYPLSRGEILVWAGVDVPGGGFLVAYSLVAAGTGLFVLSKIWKRVRVR